MIDSVILASLKSNSESLTKLKLVSLTKTDLYELLQALKTNTHLCELEFPYKHLIHAGMSKDKIAEIESVAAEINRIVKKNQEKAAIKPAGTVVPKQTYSKLLSTELKFELIQNANGALQNDWSMPRVAPALTEEDIRFLESHTIRDMLNIPKSNHDFSLKGMIVQILVGTATALGKKYLEQLIKGDPTQASSKTADRKLASIDSSGEKQPESSEVKVVKKLALKKAKSIGLKELQKKIIDGMQTLPEKGLNISQLEADKIAKLTQDHFKKVVASSAFILKIADDPSREKLVDTTLDFTKKFLVDYVQKAGKNVLMNAGSVGILIAQQLNPILLIVEGLFDSYEIDPKHEADKPPLPMWPYPSLPSDYNLKPATPALYPDPNYLKP